MKRRLVRRATAGLFALGACASLASTPPEGILTLDPTSAPSLRVEDPDGGAYELARVPAHWVFVHFWASWCAPCRREMPAIENLTAALAGNDVEIVLVNTAEDEDTVFAFLAEVAPQLHSYRDPDGDNTEAWQPRGLPATYLVDPQGRVRYQALGGRAWDEPPYLGFLRDLANGDRDHRAITSSPALP